MAAPRDILLKDWAAVAEVATEQDRAPLRTHPQYGLPPELRGIWESRVYLASTEAGSQFGGFLEGALEAAEATARDLAASLATVA